MHRKEREREMGVIALKKETNKHINKHSNAKEDFLELAKLFTLGVNRRNH